MMNDLKRKLFLLILILSIIFLNWVYVIFLNNDQIKLEKLEKENSIKIFGIMVTRSEHWVIQTWLNTHAGEFEQLVILDGTELEFHQEKIKSWASKFANVKYQHERDFKFDIRLKHKTDNNLRSLVFSMLDQEHILNQWIVIAHADEFFSQKFSDLAKLADNEGANVINFVPWYTAPYITDSNYLEEGIKNGYENFNITKYVRYTVLDYYIHEYRMFKYINKDIKWGSSHSITIPEFFPRKKDASFLPRYIHYKIKNFDVDSIANDGTFITSVWSGIPSNEIKYTNGSKIYSLIAPNKGQLLAILIRNYCSMSIIKCKKLHNSPLSHAVEMSFYPLHETIIIN